MPHHRIARVLPVTGVELCMGDVVHGNVSYSSSIPTQHVRKHVFMTEDMVVSSSPLPLHTQLVQPVVPLPYTPPVQFLTCANDTTANIDIESAGLEQLNDRTLDESFTIMDAANRSNILVMVRPLRPSRLGEREIGRGRRIRRRSAPPSTLGLRSSEYMDQAGELRGVLILPTEAIEAASAVQFTSRSDISDRLEPVAVCGVGDVEEGAPSCYICLETEDALSGSALYHSPCLCTGSSGFVHASCLQRQVTEMGLEYCTVCRSRLPVVYSTKPSSPRQLLLRRTRDFVNAHRMEILGTVGYICFMLALVFLLPNGSASIGLLVVVGLCWVCIRGTICSCTKQDDSLSSGQQGGEQVASLRIRSMQAWLPSVAPPPTLASLQ